MLRLLWRLLLREDGAGSGRVIWPAVAGTAGATVLIVHILGGGGGADLTPPVVNMTAPAPGVVSGTFAVSASASDNVSVSGVQFLLDGANLQAEDTGSPYSISWDSTTTSNGSHILSARARDPSGNTAVAPDLAITVSNGGGGAGTANLWVDVSGGSCIRRTTPSTYLNNGTECGTLSAAYLIASPGDSIGMEAGSYATDNVKYRAALANLSPGCVPRTTNFASANTTNCITVFPNDGNVIWASFLHIRGGDLWLKGTASALGATLAGRSYTFIIDDQNGNGFANDPADGSCGVGPNPACSIGQLEVGNDNSQTTGVDHFSVQGMHMHDFSIVGCVSCDIHDNEVGPAWVDNDGLGDVASCAPANFEDKIYRDNTFNIQAQFITFDRNFVHGQNRTTDADNGNACHQGGIIMFTNSRDIEFSNNVFADNMVYDMQFDGNNATYTNWTIENNWFGCTVDDASSPPPRPCFTTTAVNFNGTLTVTGFLVRFNSSYGVWHDTGTINWLSSNWIGNYGPYPADSDSFCSDADLAKDYNVTSSSNLCGGTHTLTGIARTSVFTDLNAQNPNFHLVDGTNPANNYVPNLGSDYALATDWDGQSRPIGAIRDAGSDER